MTKRLSEDRDVAFICSSGLGWVATTQRWLRAQDLLGWNLCPYPVEPHAPNVGWLWRLGVTPWVTEAALAGRRAYQRALREGHKRFFFLSQSHSLLIPLPARSSVATYGDSTWLQLSHMAGYGVAYDWGTERLERRGMKRLRSSNALMFCMSEWYKQSVTEDFQIPACRCVDLPLMIDSSIWVPSGSRSPTHAGSPLRVLFVGGDFQRKGGDVLLEARLLLGPTAEFVFVTKNAADLPSGCERYSRLPPDSPELLRVVQSCDVLALPTRGDTNSNVAIEAALCGLPSIVSAVGAIPEVVVDGVTGTVVNGWDAAMWAATISEYARDRELLKIRGVAAHARAIKVHSVEAHMSVLKQNLDELWGCEKSMATANRT